MMAYEFWLSDTHWLAIAGHLPSNQPGARRVDDRRVISGIIHVLKSGCRWRDCPTVYGPYTTIYNRWNRWSRRKVWRQLFEALRQVSPDDFQAIDRTTAKAHRSAAGGKGGRMRKRSAARGVAEQPRSMPPATPQDAPSPSK
jgi:transposase